MKKLVLNLAALAVVATGGTYLASPAAADTAAAPATCTEGGIVVTGDTCGVVNGHCKCSSLS
jgi:hypothetical protein